MDACIGDYACKRSPGIGLRQTVAVLMSPSLGETERDTMSATYSPATIKRARTILARCEAPKATPKARVKAAKKQADAWRNRPASKAQIARVQRAEIALGYDPSPKAVIGNAGAASDLYQSLKVEMARNGVRF